ncbi:hypothetical protein [Kitasatospora sp. NPDC088346]|uniref:hypothetical protein n=1 Tax=Kitasatospora sp. NPDC088346 TaxID=3364073 RepID=UPI00381800F9
MHTSPRSGGPPAAASCWTSVSSTPNPHAVAFLGPAPAARGPTEVEQVADLLGDIDFPAALAALPSDDHAAGALIGHGAEGLRHGPGTYPAAHFAALRAFFAGASQRGLAVVSWWD